MKRFKIEQSMADIVRQSGLALIGQAIKGYTMLTQELDTQVPLRHGIKHSDAVKSYLAQIRIIKPRCFCPLLKRRAGIF